MKLLHKIKVKSGKAMGAVKHRRNEPTDNQAQARAALRDAASAIAPMSTEGLSPAGVAWADHSNQFRKLCIDSDPANFLQWRVVRKTMFVDASPYLQIEYDYLRKQDDFETRWLPAITESWVGRPPRLWLDGRTSGNRMHLAYHLARYREQTGIDPAGFDCVYEFGGGYGCMCDTLHRLGFKGRYVICDLPFQSALQRYYLARNGRTIRGIDEPGPGVCLVNDPADLNPAVNGLTGRRLFLATWSLSETPLDVRPPTEALTGDFNSYLIGYQRRFEQVDNEQYFRQWIADRPHLQADEQAIDHLKGSVYLFGRP